MAHSRKFALSIAFSLAFASVQAPASEITVAGANVKTIMPYADGSYFVAFTVSDAACINGNNPKRHYVRVGAHGMTAEGARAIYAAALSALLADRPITFSFDDTDNTCAITRLLIG